MNDIVKWTTPVPVPPCSRCGTLGGRPVNGLRKPTRYAGEKYGVVGRICWDCKRELHGPTVQDQRVKHRKARVIVIKPDDAGDGHDPTEAEILLACAAIREQWSNRQKRKRKVNRR